MHELKALGLRTFLDPCPIDLARDAEFMAEVAQATGVHIICATGLYKEDQGATPYFKFRAQFSDALAEMTEIVHQASSPRASAAPASRPASSRSPRRRHRISPYEEMVLRAAARAAKATGAPITTHTDEGTMGREQLDIFASEGVDLHRVIVGHSCGSADLRYHVDMLDRGCYLGFDRFGLEILQPDRCARRR